MRDIETGWGGGGITTDSTYAELTSEEVEDQDQSGCMRYILDKSVRAGIKTERPMGTSPSTALKQSLTLRRWHIRVRMCETENVCGWVGEGGVEGGGPVVTSPQTARTQSWF